MPRRAAALGSARLDELGPGLRAPAKELEERLLVLAVSGHTESGKHVKRLTDWEAWWSRSGVDRCAPAEGRRLLESGAGRRALALGTLRR